MNQSISEKLITVIVSAFELTSKDIEISSEDVSDITSIANRQKILPIIVDGLKNIGRSDLLTEKMLKDYAKAVYDHTQREVSLKVIADAFEKESIAYIPLKGSILCDYYPQPWMRTSSDIDVLIHEEDLDKATRILETKTEFGYLRTARHDIHFVNRYVHLELHFSFDYAVKKITNALSNPWDNAVSVNDSFMYSFTPEYTVFYNVSHAAKHFIQNGGIGIRPILDLYVLRKHTEFDEDKVKSLCDDAGVLGFYNQCIKLIDVWFNSDIHDNLSQSFEDIVISGGVFGSKHLKMVSNKRRDSGKKYISGRIFKTSEELKNYYPKCRKHPILVPYYQVVRWTKIFDVNKTKEYVSEVKQADSIDQSEVEKYDKLLKAMGL